MTRFEENGDTVFPPVKRHNCPSNCGFHPLSTLLRAR